MHSYLPIIIVALTCLSYQHYYSLKRENGKNKLYKGRVISHMPGFPDWFNVVYNDEPGVVYSYKLSEDLERGVL